MVAGGEAKRNHRINATRRIALRQEREKDLQCLRLTSRCITTSFLARKIENPGLRLTSGNAFTSTLVAFSVAWTEFLMQSAAQVIMCTC